MLNIVLDENIPTSLITSLESLGYRVCHIGIVSHGISDHEVLSLCNKEQAILITQDSDFGTIIFFSQKSHTYPIIYVRYHDYQDWLGVQQQIINLLSIIGMGFYYTVTNKQIRKRPL